MAKIMYGLVLPLVIVLLSSCGGISNTDEMNDASKTNAVNKGENNIPINKPNNEPKNEPENEKVEDEPIKVDTPGEEHIVVAEAFGGETFDIPVGIRHAGDGSGRIFIIEKPGTIAVLSGDMNKPARKVFIDLQDTVYSRGNEQGLLGLAFHPDFKNNGKFYVNYTTKKKTVIASYKTKSDGSGLGDPASGKVLLSFDQPFDNHNGGELAFGPDGYLYIASGDGGSGNDPRGNGQNLKKLLGKMLRIDVDQSSGDRNYAIPKDNPFYQNDKGAREEIYAYGLRNPWRFSFDRDTGKLWAADVGQNSLEEIDIIENGHNYGWNTMEGSRCFKPKKGCDVEGITTPIWEYTPEGGGASITGGYVYRGEQISSLVGKYIFADFVDGRVWTLSYDGANKATAKQLDMELYNITSFGEDEAGEIYASVFSGEIVRLSTTQE
jgi:glucose/arabinose dehydrogenase